MLLRILIFLLSLVLAASAITYFASLDGVIEAEAFGQKFYGPSGLIAGAFAALIALVVLITSFAKDIMRIPSVLRQRDKETKRTRGVAALARGLEAVAVGDAADAAHHAKIARRHLEDQSLTRLLTAQAAHLSGDEVVARENYAAMLEAPETEFLGLRGLYLHAMARDDQDTARQYAERAFALRSNARWAFDSVFDLCLERGAWGDARAALEKARKNKLRDNVQIDRAVAALLTADADAANSAGDAKTALQESDAALKLAPGFAPAAVLAARLHNGEGRRGKAMRILETAFAAAPHPALSRTYLSLLADDASEKRASALQALAGKAPDSSEAKLLLARSALLKEEWAEAIAIVEPLLADTQTTEELTVMAEAMTGEFGEASGRGWLELAAAAPRDPRPGVDGEFHFTKEGWARLVREYMERGELSPPPLEAAQFALTADDIKLRLAPPETSEEIEDTEETGPDAPYSDKSTESGGDSAEAKMSPEKPTADPQDPIVPANPPDVDPGPVDSDAPKSPAGTG